MYAVYQGLENRDAADETAVSHNIIVRNLKDFINKAEPLWDVDKKNSCYYRYGSNIKLSFLGFTISLRARNHFLLRSDQLYHNKTKLTVDLEHIRAENAKLASDLEERPSEILPLVRAAADTRTASK